MSSSDESPCNFCHENIGDKMCSKCGIRRYCSRGKRKKKKNSMKPCKKVRNNPKRAENDLKTPNVENTLDVNLVRRLSRPTIRRLRIRFKKKAREEEKEEGDSSKGEGII